MSNGAEAIAGAWERRGQEARHQEAELRAEFARWRAETAEDKPLEKHQSQVLAITGQLEGLLDELESRSTQAEYYQALVTAHRIWSYFSAKFALRGVTWLSDDLICSDEFAYACYSPAVARARNERQIGNDALKEPPLVYFTNDVTPYAQERGSYFSPDGIDGEQRRRFGRLLYALPVPLVGVPWFQLGHLPLALSIAHEVGHAVEADFGLTDLVEEAFDALPVPGARREGWREWCHEIFADYYGLLCVGPAHLLALSSYLSLSPDAVRSECQGPDEAQGCRAWQPHPPGYLRIKLNSCALARMELEDMGVLAAWQESYGWHKMEGFERDIAAVLDALWSLKPRAFGGVALSEVISFTEDDLRNARSYATDVLETNAFTPGMPFRHLFAGAALAYNRSPQRYLTANEKVRLAKRMVAAVPSGVRGPDDDRRWRNEQASEAFSGDHRKRGRQLYDLFKD